MEGVFSKFKLRTEHLRTDICALVRGFKGADLGILALQRMALEVKILALFATIERN